MAFNIHEFQKNLTSAQTPIWKPGQIETTSPNADEKMLAIEYLVLSGGTTGRFRLKDDPENPSPGKLFHVSRSAIFAWQRYHQEFHLENGDIVHVPGEFINDDGTFKTSGETFGA
jgi:hypothetical protein